MSSRSARLAVGAATAAEAPGWSGEVPPATGSAPYMYHMGQNSDTCCLHWLELKLKCGPYELSTLFEQKMASGRGVPETTLLADSRGDRFYERGKNGDGVWMRWSHRYNDDGEVWLQIRGEAFERFGEAVVMGFVGEVWKHVADVPRVDVAFDGVMMKPEEWYRDYKVGKVKRAVDFVDNERGRAAWMGKLNAGCSQLCMYDERGPVRLEFRTRKRDIGKKIIGAYLAHGVGEMADVTLAAVRGQYSGVWGPLDEWLGKGERVIGAVRQRGDARSGLLTRVPGAARVLVLYGCSSGGVGAVARAMASAAKEISADALDEHGINWREVADMWGRKGPDGYNARVAEVAAELEREWASSDCRAEM